MLLLAATQGQPSGSPDAAVARLLHSRPAAHALAPPAAPSPGPGPGPILRLCCALPPFVTAALLCQPRRGRPSRAARPQGPSRVGAGRPSAARRVTPYAIPRRTAEQPWTPTAPMETGRTYACRTASLSTPPPAEAPLLLTRVWASLQHHVFLTALEPPRAHHPEHATGNRAAPRRGRSTSPSPSP